MSVALALTACAGELDGQDELTEQGEPSWVPVTSAAAWTVAPDGEDPFAALRPDDANCDDAGHGLDDFGGELSYEIDTGMCNYLSLTQSLLRSLPAGTPLELRVWHFELDAGAGVEAEAYLGLAFGERIVHEQRVGIPADAGLIVAELELDEGLPLGAPLTVHVHNHGANTWNILSLEAYLEL